MTQKETDTGHKDKFLGFVLLSSPELDAEALCANFKEDWGFECPSSAIRKEEYGTSVIFAADGKLPVTVALLALPVPDGEAEYWAQSNFMEREQAMAAAKSHAAHLLVAVMGGGREAGELYVKVAASCLRLPNALGIYTNGTVWTADYFIRVAQEMKNGTFPLLGLVFVGLVKRENGICGYTNGLEKFGREEIEIIDSAHTPQEIYVKLLDIAGYVIEQDAVLRDGQTLGATIEERLPITLSDGVHVAGKSLKIGF